MFENWQQFLDDVGEAEGYPHAFKLLGAVFYIREAGIEPLLSGEKVSPRTTYRWLETIRMVGWGSLVSEVRVLQAVREHLESLHETDADTARESITKLLDAAMATEGAPF